MAERAKPTAASGVNSFGISGTNAHIILEEHRSSDEGPEREDLRRAPRLLPLSGKTEGALRDSAGLYLSWLEQRAGELSSQNSGPTNSLLSDMAWTASIGRRHFDYRAGVVFDDLESLSRQLQEIARADSKVKRDAPSRVAFAYTGQGSQWAGMGRDIYETFPVAKAVFDRCEAVFREQRGESLLDVMFGRSGATGELGDTAWEQPALYALECALTALWADMGIRPHVVVGHSVGELAAAQAAGVFDLEDGMRFAEARGALLSATEEGAMVAVFAPKERVASIVEAFNGEVAGPQPSVSADNGLHQVVSGPVAQIETVSKRFESEGIRVRRLNTTRAFHSVLVEPALNELEASLAGMSIASPNVDLISNLTGERVGASEKLDGKYWRRHAREPVAFAQGIRTMADLGVDLVIEIGPGPVLAPMALSAWPESERALPQVLPGLCPPSPESGERQGFIDAVARVYETGTAVDFRGLFPGESRHRISIPGYPFQRERHWLDSSKRRRREMGHPLLGVRHESAGGEIAYETQLFPSDPVWLEDHRVFGHIVAPGALYGAMAATASLIEGGSICVENMQLHNPLVFSKEGPEDAPRPMQVLLNERSVGVYSKNDDGEWIVHVEGQLSTNAPASKGPERVNLDELKEGMAPVPVADYYRARAATGIDLGPAFQTLANLWADSNEALGEIALPENLGQSGLDIHPLVLDGCFQVMGAARGLSGVEGSTTYLPFGWEQLWLAGPLPERVFCHVRMRESSRERESESQAPAEVRSGELYLYNPDGILIGQLSGHTVKRATQGALLSAIEGTDDLLYEVAWRERALAVGLEPADFFPNPAVVKGQSRSWSEYLSNAGVDPRDRIALLADLERWSHSYALANLDRLGWQRTRGEFVDLESLRKRLDVAEEHGKLFLRMLEMLAKSGVLKEENGGFTVLSASDDPWPKDLPRDPEGFAEQMAQLYSHGQVEIGLFRRSADALTDVLQGRADPLTLLFSSGEPTAADLYLRAPVARAANQMLSEAVRTLVAELPVGRKIRVIEVGAGTGSATASILPELPEGRFEYMYTDISAGFFSEAEARFGNADGNIDYRHWISKKTQRPKATMPTPMTCWWPPTSCTRLAIYRRPSPIADSFSPPRAN